MNETYTHKIHIVEVKDKYKIDRIIKACDNAFLMPVSKRRYYNDLLSKISRNAVFLLAENNFNDILGYVAIYINNFSTKVAYITLIAVNNKFQGQGIGKLLLKKCEEYARNSGFKIIRLEVNKNNLKARSFYYANDFIATGEEKEESIFLEKVIN